MKFEFKSSFDRSVKSFRGREKEEIKKVALQAINILSQDRMLHKGIGLKRLKGDFWDRRKGRVCFIIYPITLSIH